MIFGETHGINDGLANICFLGLFVGILLSMVLVPILYRRTANQLKRDGDDGSGRMLDQESRLLFALVGAPFIPVGLFWMGWTDYVSFFCLLNSWFFFPTLTRNAESHGYRFGLHWRLRS